MAESNGLSTPIGCEENNVKEKITVKVPYQDAVSCLMYLTTVSNPNIAFTVNKTARMMEDPIVQDWNQVKRIFRCMKNTVDYGIKCNNKERFKVYSNDDYAGDQDMRHSMIGVVTTISHEAVSWTSQLQKSVATPTIETEMISASEGIKKLIWLKRLLRHELTGTSKQVKHSSLYVDKST
ncbi:uncharacterized protein LOC126346203 [Schistocerca gregaria]|uniref:uncharacterized protein LOC126346203 n=1 Tax=Schistocerca gregaria TaxID=7010 RepID=UPI00211ED5FE|nr:uncharacterized protein LOC126346203 [Schistocerca gregaria]